MKGFVPVDGNVVADLDRHASTASADCSGDRSPTLAVKDGCRHALASYQGLRRVLADP